MRTFSARETTWLQELDGIELAGFRRRALAFLLDWIVVGIILSLTATLGTTAYVSLAKAMGHPTDVFLDFGHGNIETNSDKPNRAADTAPGVPCLSSATPAATTPPATATSPSKWHVNVQRLHPEESFFHELAGESLHIFADILVPCLYFGLFLWRWNGRTPGKRLMKIRVVSLVHPHMTFWHSVERALGYGAAALEAGFGFLQYFLHPCRRCAQDRLAETIVVTERSYNQTLPNINVPDEPTVS